MPDLAQMGLTQAGIPTEHGTTNRANLTSADLEAIGQLRAIQLRNLANALVSVAAVLQRLQVFRVIAGQ